MSDMPTYEIGFKVQHDCPYTHLTMKHPEAVIALWCNHTRHVMEISCKNIEVFQGLQESLQDFARTVNARILRKSFSGTNLQMVLQQCRCSDLKSSVSDCVENHNCLIIEPSVFTGGWERYRIIAFNQKDISRLFKSLSEFCKLEITSRKMVSERTVKDNFVISVDNLFGELTMKQLQALVFALDNGYYHVPRRVTTEEMASKLDVPRTTYEEHLRKAESKVLEAVTPYIQLKAQS